MKHGAVMATIARGAGYRVTQQTPASERMFGDFRGQGWFECGRRHVPESTIRRSFAALEEASDTGEVVRLVLDKPCTGEFTVRTLESGLLLTTWRPYTHDERIEALIRRWPALP